MGMLINGKWTEEDDKVKNGIYIRKPSIYKKPISKNILTDIVANPGRFILFASYSCAWSHRAMLAIVIKELEHTILIQMIGGKRIQGYPMNNNEPFTLPNTRQDVTYLHQLYTMSDAQYTGRVTVPVLWDSLTGKIICNESSMILRSLNTIGNKKVDLSPSKKIEEIHSWNDDIYENLSNAVYEVGFSTSSQKKESSILKIKNFLDKMENHLEDKRFILGDILTETDINLFTSLIRFDTCYYTIFKCSSKKLTSYKNLMTYTKRIYQIPNIAKTINFDLMYKMSVENDSKENQQVLPKPDINFMTPIISF